jgi:hypothetical protein
VLWLMQNALKMIVISEVDESQLLYHEVSSEIIYQRQGGVFYKSFFMMCSFVS